MIDIWVADVDGTDNEIQRYDSLLSAAESARSGRFRYARDRIRYTARHGILRVLLSVYMICAPPEVEIQSDSKGKPYLVDRTNETPLQFSMSHSAGLAVFAFARSAAIGVDIERIYGFPEMREIVSLNFTAAEIKEMDDCPESNRVEAFFKLWVRKEAVLKASGEGLMVPLRGVDVSTQIGNKGARIVRIEGDSMEREFRLRDVMVAQGFAAALATAYDGYDHMVNYLHYKFGMMELGI